MTGRQEGDPAGRDRPWSPTAPGLLLGLLALALYLPTLGFGFTGWDDTRYITENPLMVEEGGLSRIWFSGEADQYYPLTFTSFWIEHRLWGGAPVGYHAVNLLLHALNTGLLIVGLHGLGFTRWTASLTGALFAVHPVQVITVAWIAERKNLLSTLFCLLVFHSWIRFRRGGKERWYAAALALFLLALLCKTAVVALPVALVALDRCLLGVSWRGSIARALPLALPVVPIGLVTVQFEQPYIEGMPARATRPLIAGQALLFYVRQILAPVWLFPFYRKWSVSAVSLASWLPLGLVSLGALAFARFRHRLGGAVVYGIVHFTVFLLPALGLLDYGNLALSYVGDQYLYFACIGLFLLLAHALDALGAGGPRAAARLVTPAAALLLLLLSGRTLAYMPSLRDGTAFWTKCLEGDPDSPAAHAGLGRVSEARGDWEAAAVHYRRAAALLPGVEQLWVDLSRALRRAGRLEEAEEAILRVGGADDALREIGAGRADGTYDAIPDALFERARIARDRRRFAEAVQFYEAGLALDPTDALAHLELGGLHLGLLQRERAAPHFERAIALDPTRAEAYLGLATSQRGMGRYGSAVASLEEGLRALPGRASILNLLARILATCSDNAVRDGAGAVAAAEEAVRAGDVAGWSSVEERAGVLDTLAAAYAEAGRWPDAVEAARAALEAARSEREALEAARSVGEAVGATPADREAVGATPTDRRPAEERFQGPRLDGDAAVAGAGTVPPDRNAARTSFGPSSIEALESHLEQYLRREPLREEPVGQPR